MDDFSPSTIVLRNRDSETKKRAEMSNTLMGEAAKRRISIRLLSRSDVKNAFPDCNRNKYTIAAAAAKQLVELAPRLPSVRKIWKSEDYRMSIFDAAALGVAYFTRRRSFTFRSPENKTKRPRDLQPSGRCARKLPELKRSCRRVDYSDPRGLVREEKVDSPGRIVRSPRISKYTDRGSGRR